MDGAVVVAKVSKESSGEAWHCHCCTAKNEPTLKKCRVCGRPDTYGLSGYPLPFHGKYATAYRPAQLIDVMDDIHETDSENWTALHVACANSNTPLVKELLKYKSQIEALTNKGQTALHLATHCGSVDCVQQLLKHGAKINVATYTEMETPLHMACSKGYARIAQLLILGGADINSRNILRRTPLHCSAVSGRVDIALLLLRAGAELKPLDAHGWEPQQLAEMFSHRDLQELLLREGMTEKQAVMKELPPMPWHSDVWFEVVKMQTNKRAEHERSLRLHQEGEARLAAIREEARQRQLEERKEQRRQELVRYKQEQGAYKVVKRLT